LAGHGVDLLAGRAKPDPAQQSRGGDPPVWLARYTQSVKGLAVVLLCAPCQLVLRAPGDSMGVQAI
jgi:hypothetical protein